MGSWWCIAVGGIGCLLEWGLGDRLSVAMRIDGNLLVFAFYLKLIGYR